MRPLRKVATELSVELAYAVGLLVSDGCLSKDGRHIDFTSKDLELIETFKKCLNLINIKTGYKSSGTGRLCPRVQFGDVKFYNFLLGLGLTPNKSKTLSNLTIPDNYFFDYLRGYFDGDGATYSYWDKRWHSSYMFYLSFACASLNHLEWLRAILYKLNGIRGRIGPGIRCYQLKFAKQESKILIERMFYSTNIPFLKRKFEKIKKILAIENNHDKCPG